MRNDVPPTYMARLTNRQWRLIVSALSESENPECEGLADDLLKYVLPPLGPVNEVAQDGFTSETS